MGAKIQNVVMLDNVIVDGASETFEPETSKLTFHAAGETSAGAGTADIDIELSNDESATKNWIVGATISLTLATTTSGDGFVSAAAWKYVRANLSNLTGTDATVRCYMARSGAE